jgi:hypothetical protein
VYFRLSGKVSCALEKFPEVLENFPDYFCKLFYKKQLSNQYQYFILSGKFHFLWKSFKKIWKTFQTI